MCVRHLTATSGSGTRGTWEGMLAFPPEEDALPVTLRAYANSAVDGAMIDLVERQITISTERPDIIVTSPRCGDVYPAGTLIQVLGTANLFEASLTVELRDSSGTPVVTLPVTAEECCVESQFSASAHGPRRAPLGLLRFRGLQPVGAGREPGECVRGADRSDRAFRGHRLGSSVPFVVQP